MDPDAVDSSSARKRQKVGDIAGSLSSKKVWRNDNGRDYFQDGYQDQSYGDYARKGYGNDLYSSGQKHQHQQRETGDRYYSRDNYASNTGGDATSWKARSASPWYDEYNAAGYGASSSWNNNASGSNAGGRYRGDYAADPYYSTAEGGFGRASTRQDGYGYQSGAYRGNNHLERAEGAPSSSTNAYYRADGYASSRYNYDYNNAYHDRFDERGYGPDTTTPVTNRYNTSARGAGRYGFSNAFRTGNAAGAGANGKYATNFKTRQYSFGAKKANFIRENTKSNANKNSSNSSEEAQAEEKEPEKPKVITDQSVKDFLTLRTNLLDFHLTMALLKLSLKPDLELRQKLIANTIAAPPVEAAPATTVTAVPTVEAAKNSTTVDSTPALVRCTSGIIDARSSGQAKQLHQQQQLHQQSLGPGVPLVRASSFNPAGHASANDVVTPQMKRAVSAQFGRNVDNNNSNSMPFHHPPSSTSGARDDTSRPEFVRRDSAHKEKTVLTTNRFDTPEVPGRQSSISRPREDDVGFPQSASAELAVNTPRADLTKEGREGRELSRDRSSARSVSRPRGYEESAVPASSSLPPSAQPLHRETSGGNYSRGNAARGNSRERTAAGAASYRTNLTSAGGALSQSQGYERGRSREPQRDSYGYPPHHQQQQGYYNNYPAGGGYGESQQYGSYDDRYGYADGYGYDDRGYGYPRGGGAEYAAGYEQTSAARRDHSRGRPPIGGDAYSSGAYAGRYEASQNSGGGRDTSINRTGGGRSGAYPDQRGNAIDGEYARQQMNVPGNAPPGRRSRSPSQSQSDRRRPQTQPQVVNRTTHGQNTNANAHAARGSDGPGSAAKQALAKLETQIQQMQPPEGGKRSRSPSATPQQPFRSIHGSSDSLHAASRSRNQSPEPGQVEEDAPGQQQVQFQQNHSSLDQSHGQGVNVNRDDGGFRGPQHKKVFNKNFNANQQHQQHQKGQQQVLPQQQVRNQKNFHQNHQHGQTQGQAQGQSQQGSYQNPHQHQNAPVGQNQQQQGPQQGKFQQPQQAAIFNGNNKFHKNQNKFPQKSGAPGSAGQQHQQQGQQQRQHQAGATTGTAGSIAAGAGNASNVKSPVKKLAPGEAPPLRTPR